MVPFSALLRSSLNRFGSARRGGALSLCAAVFATVSGNIACRNFRQACDVGVMVAPPDLALPKAVEALNGVLKPRLAWRGKYRNDLQRQTRAADPADSVGVVVRTLEDCVVAELCVCRQSLRAPAAHQGIERELRAVLWHHSSISDGAIQTGAGKHRNERTVSDLRSSIKSKESSSACADATSAFA